MMNIRHAPGLQNLIEYFDWTDKYLKFIRDKIRCIIFKIFFITMHYYCTVEYWKNGKKRTWLYIINMILNLEIFWISYEYLNFFVELNFFHNLKKILIIPSMGIIVLKYLDAGKSFTQCACSQVECRCIAIGHLNISKHS